MLLKFLEQGAVSSHAINIIRIALKLCCQLISKILKPTLSKFSHVNKRNYSSV